MKATLAALALFAFLLQTVSAESQVQSPPPASSDVVAPKLKRPVEDVIPLTMGNIRGHEMLYNEGWFVVSSSKKAFAFAKEHSISSSGQALSKVLRDAHNDTTEYASAVKEGVSGAAATGARITTKGTKQTGALLSETHELAKEELAYAKENFGEAMNAFVAGTIGIAKRTEDDRRELASIPGNYYGNLKHDFSNIYTETSKVHKKFAGRIDAGWDKAFTRASEEFRAEYERSGESQNTLTALGPVLLGWLKAFYQGIAAPTSKTIVKTTSAGVTYTVFLPIAATSVVAGRSVQAVGLTVYYAGKTGIKIISPTIEGGLLASLSLLSTAAVPVTYAGGAAVGAMNQVAFTVAGPAVAVGEGAGATAVDTAGYVAFVTYDAAAGATKVVLNQAASGVVLGYNALTAIPTHLLLGAEDAVFLSWEGPRLVIAAARGEVGSKDAAARISDLPIGTVVDLKKLESAGVKVDVLTTDEQVIKDVLEKLPNDLRESDNALETTK
jgi:hypothetical protein